MRKIDKGEEPPSLTTWRRRHPRSRYDNLDYAERQDIRDACLAEQFYLCAYCCKSLIGNNTDSMNEHVESRKIMPHKSLNFDNIVCSCTTPKQCDNAHSGQTLPLTPLMDECETELKYKISGRVEGLTDRARESIRVLNLGDAETNNKALVEKRKKLVYDILFEQGLGIDDPIEDDELIRSVINDIYRPIDGRFTECAPVVVNILNGWLGVDH